MKIIDLYSKTINGLSINFLMNIFFIAAVLSCFGCRKTQSTFKNNIKTYSDTTDLVGFQVIRLANGSYLAACYEDIRTDAVFLVNVDYEGNKLWTKNLPVDTVVGGAVAVSYSLTAINSIAATPDGGFVTGGYNVCKYSATGDLQWSNSHWGDSLTNIGFAALAVYYYPMVSVALDGSIFLTYQIHDADSVNITQKYYFYVSKLSQQGVLMYSKLLYVSDSVSHIILKTLALPDGIYVTGQATFTNLNAIVGQTSNYFAMKYSYDGNLAWYTSPNYDPSNPNIQFSDALDICSGANNTIVLACDSSTTGNAINYDLAGFQTLFSYPGIVTYEALETTTGKLLNTKTLSETYPRVDVHPFFTGTNDGGYITTVTCYSNDRVFLATGLTGTNSIYTNSSIRLEKTDANMNAQWVKTLNTINNVVPFGVYQTSDGGYLIFASIQTYGKGTYDMIVLKTDAQGNIVNN